MEARRSCHIHSPKQSESEVPQSCPTLCDPMDTRFLRPWDFLGKSTGVGCLFLLQRTSWPRDRTQVSRIVDRRFTVWATREVSSVDRLIFSSFSASWNNLVYPIISLSPDQISRSVVSISLRPHGHQAPLSMGFSRQEYWSGLPFPFPGNLPDPGIKSAYLVSPAMAGGVFNCATW